MAEDKIQSASWSATIQFLQEVGDIHKEANRALIACKLDRKYLLTAGDYVHRFYGLVSAYCNATELEKLDRRDFNIQEKLNNFQAYDENMRALNFFNYFKELDSFYIEIQRLAVDKNIFPRPNVLKSLKELTGKMRQE